MMIVARRVMRRVATVLDVFWDAELLLTATGLGVLVAGAVVSFASLVGWR